MLESSSFIPSSCRAPEKLQFYSQLRKGVITENGLGVKTVASVAVKMSLLS
jgi:hypothetical protein